MYMYIHIDKIVSFCQWRHVSLQPTVCQCRKVGINVYPGSNSTYNWNLLQAGRKWNRVLLWRILSPTAVLSIFVEKQNLWISLSSWSNILVLVKCNIYEHTVLIYIYRLWINIFLKLPTGLMKLHYLLICLFWETSSRLHDLHWSQKSSNPIDPMDNQKTYFIVWKTYNIYYFIYSINCYCVWSLHPIE